MYKLVLLRHGESIWNQENRFTGWTDVDLSDKGKNEARKSGAALKKAGFVFDAAYTSVLKRAIRTLWIVLDEMDLMGVPVFKSWHLNERHYGLLQGLNKSETAVKFGDEQVLVWRRSYDVRPPPLAPDDPRSPKIDPHYRNVPADDLPLTESLKDTETRFLYYWHAEIEPALQSGQNLIITAHGNTLRSLVKHIDRISDKDIINLNIPTGIPLIYELDSNLNPTRHYYLEV